VRRADNLTSFMCRLSGNLGASTSWNPLGLHRPVTGLLYLFTFNFISWNECLRFVILMSVRITIVKRQEKYFAVNTNSVMFLIWQHVSTSEGHLQESSIKYITEIVYTILYNCGHNSCIEAQKKQKYVKIVVYCVSLCSS
jgi:hypothetical protein